MNCVSEFGVKITACIVSLILVNILVAQPEPSRRYTVGIAWGYNYWGNTISISYEHRLTDNWSAGLGYSNGLFSFEQKAHTTMFGFVYSGDYDLWIDLHNKQFIDFAVYYHRTTSNALCFFNGFGFGLSHYHVTFEESMMVLPDWEYRGEKDFVNSALLLSANIVEYRPNNLDALSFSCGVKAHCTIIDAPVEMRLYYGSFYYDLVETSSIGFIPIIYPQVYLKVGLSL